MTDEPETALMTRDEPAAEPTSTLALLQAAVAQGMAPEQLEKLMDLYERDKRTRAADQFARALTAFQSECPPVKKERTANVASQKGNYSYQFASYDDVMRGAGPVLAKHGIAVSFSSKPAQAGIEVICRVRVGTHTEETVVTVPVPALNVSDTQKYGAALSYAKRFAVCAALNIVITDEDSDAVALDYLNTAQVAELEELIAEKGANLRRFLEFAGAESIDKIPQARFNELADALRRKPAVKGGAK